jgi:signal peptidase I
MNGKNNNFKPLKFYETWTFVIIVCIILPICFRAFLYSPRHIPSSSMKPTLLIGDYIFISKFAYGFSKYSFPFGYKINYFDGRIGESEKPKRGDIIVFRPPNDPQTDYIKRLIGLPGDRIQMQNGRLILNGEVLPIKRVEDFLEEKPDGTMYNVKRYTETLPNGVSYKILDEIQASPSDDTEEFVVPENHYFFVGDNRDNSADSRVSIGYVPQENLIGKAEIIFFSNKSNFIEIWNWVTSFRKNRFLIDLYND